MHALTKLTTIARRNKHFVESSVAASCVALTSENRLMHSLGDKQTGNVHWRFSAQVRPDGEGNESYKQAVVRCGNHEWDKPGHAEPPRSAARLFN